MIDSTPVTITITGRPFSKKNSRNIFHRGGKTYNLPSKAYAGFREEALWQLKRAPKFPGPVHIDYTFYIKGHMHQDADNAMASIDDVLEDAGVIANDDLIVKWSGRKICGSREWKTVVQIAPCVVDSG